jgi:hypothetical protein
MLGVFAEFETNLRRERQLEGIAKAKAAGVYKGRPPSIEVSRVRELKAPVSIDFSALSRLRTVVNKPEIEKWVANSPTRVPSFAQRWVVQYNFYINDRK